MTNNAPANKWPLPLMVVFCIVTALLIAGKSWIVKWGVNLALVIVGNIILFAVSLTSLLLYQRAMAHASTMGFLRNTYSGLLLKLFVIIIAVLIYAMVARGHINKEGIFACVFLYFLYALLEIRSLMQWNKARRNA